MAYTSLTVEQIKDTMADITVRFEGTQNRKFAALEAGDEVKFDRLCDRLSQLQEEYDHYSRLLPSETIEDI